MEEDMKFKTDEIVSVIRQEIARYKGEMDVARVGRVLEVGDGIALIYGLSDAMVAETLEFESGVSGQVFNLETNSIGAVIYGSCEKVIEGSEVRGTGKLLEVPVGDKVLGRVIDPLGKVMDGQGELKYDAMRPLEIAAPGIAERQPVDEPLLTGIKAIDAMTPIGRGQRELIIGDRKTGKTSIAVDTILAQKDTGVLCIYVAIGQKESTVAGVVETLKEHGAMDYTCVVSACSSDPAPMQYIAPYSGCAIAEHFMHTHGAATLVIYDDLTKQAAAYRQISLLLRRPPGREAYPGDIFYLHSRLLERGCKLAEKYVIAPSDTPQGAKGIEGVDGKVYTGPIEFKKAKSQLDAMADKDSLKIHRLGDSGGSMTCLPICETQEGEVAAYIPTNLIGITDGQIYLEPSLFFAGVRPAINVGISVSRVGYKAASPAMKKVAQSLRLDLAAYRELSAFAQLGMELDVASQRQLDRGERMTQLLVQPEQKPQSSMDTAIAIFAGTQGYLDNLPVDEVDHFESGLLEYLKSDYLDLYNELREVDDLPDELKKQLAKAIATYKDKEYRRERKARSQEEATG